MVKKFNIFHTWLGGYKNYWLNKVSCTKKLEREKSEFQLGRFWLGKLWHIDQKWIVVVIIDGDNDLGWYKLMM